MNEFVAVILLTLAGATVWFLSALSFERADD